MADSATKPERPAVNSDDSKRADASVSDATEDLVASLGARLDHHQEAIEIVIESINEHNRSGVYKNTRRDTLQRMV